MRWFVPALCVMAATTAVVVGEVDGAPQAADAVRSGEPGADDAPTGQATTLPSDAVGSTPLAGPAVDRILEDCLAVPDGADPSLSPDPDHVEPAASGQTPGVAVVLWTGPSPQYRSALGTCIALDRGAGWTVVGRSVRRDLGEDAASVTWQTAASEDGAGAALVGRARRGETDLYLTLDDGRTYHQQVSDRFVAIPWQPVRDPVRVTAVADGEVTYAGSLTGYGDV